MDRAACGRPSHHFARADPPHHTTGRATPEPARIQPDSPYPTLPATQATTTPRPTRHGRTEGYNGIRWVQTTRRIPSTQHHHTTIPSHAHVIIPSHARTVAASHHRVAIQSHGHPITQPDRPHHNRTHTDSHGSPQPATGTEERGRYAATPTRRRGTPPPQATEHPDRAKTATRQGRT